MKKEDPILCYIRDDWAYFTTQPLAEACGEGWSKVPYEHNSSPPRSYDAMFDGARFKRKPWAITKVAFDGAFTRPSTDYGNSPFSVVAINKGAAPWLRTEFDTIFVAIPAGTPLSRFKELVREAGGKVYVEEAA